MPGGPLGAAQSLLAQQCLDRLWNEHAGHLLAETGVQSMAEMNVIRQGPVDTEGVGISEAVAIEHRRRRSNHDHAPGANHLGAVGSGRDRIVLLAVSQQEWVLWVE